MGLGLVGHVCRERWSIDVYEGFGHSNSFPNTPNHQTLPFKSQQQADGLPLVYEPDVIKKYWDKRPSEMQRRWALFLSVTAPFITKLVRFFTQGTILKVGKDRVFGWC